jgi:hypothetical protein
MCTQMADIQFFNDNTQVTARRAFQNNGKFLQHRDMWAIDPLMVSAHVILAPRSYTAADSVPGEGPLSLIDNNADTKWVDADYTSPLFFELAQVPRPTRLMECNAAPWEACLSQFLSLSKHEGADLSDPLLCPPPLQSFNIYRYRTGNDDEARDPVRWIIDYSADCSTNWRVVDDRSTDVQSVPTARLAWTRPFFLPGAPTPVSAWRCMRG